ncbi:MAG: hypothetical protein K0S71_586 [Clostridia bacterium]|jgi:hypothetical protein|nr:hypothetical protein [Clostridia bacterium]
MNTKVLRVHANCKALAELLESMPEHDEFNTFASYSLRLKIKFIMSEIRRDTLALEKDLNKCNLE